MEIFRLLDSGMLLQTSSEKNSEVNIIPADVCEICSGVHLTSEHSCSVCGLTGIKSHEYVACPSSCKICYGSHLTTEHKRFMCTLCGTRLHNGSKCPDICKICGGYHLTSEHKCATCGLVGINSHDYMVCPNKSDINYKMIGYGTIIPVHPASRVPFVHEYHYNYGIQRLRLNKTYESLGRTDRHKCKICDGCHATEEHKCFICGLAGVKSHTACKCPDKCKLCDMYHLPDEHKCFICGLVGINSHEHKDCPDIYKICDLPYTIGEHNSLYGED